MKSSTQPPAEAVRQARLLAESLDAAAADLAEYGPVSAEELALMLGEFEAEQADNHGRPLKRRAVR
jgi:hypothetical protein